MADEIKTTAAEAPESRNFIHTFIEEDIAQGGQFEGMTVHTRFPPEPNGYLHIGHCKALTIDFGTAEKFGGLCNLRMDDTNPTKEDEEFVEAIKEDIHWLGFDWGDRFFYGSDYFEEDYRQAVGLIRRLRCQGLQRLAAAGHVRRVARQQQVAAVRADADAHALHVSV